MTPSPTEARTALDALASYELASCDRAGLDAVLAHLRALRSYADAVEVRVARRSRELADEGRSEHAADVLRDGGRRSGRDGKAAADREAVCTSMPGFETALGGGSVSTGHLDAVAAATHKLSEAERQRFTDRADRLVAEAEQMSVDLFNRRCRELAREVQHDAGVSRLENQRRQCSMRRRIDRFTGMYHFHLELDPESGAKVWDAVSGRLRAVRRRLRDDPTITGERMGAVAMTELIIGARAVEHRIPEISVLIDLETLLGELHEHSICETSQGILLPPSTVRRMCCDARILPVVLGGSGELLDLGRSIRTANRAQRRALRARYRTCAHPDCDVPVDECEAHHVIWWERLGRTDIDNLLPLCSRHHHLVHEGGWGLTLRPDRHVTLTRPDGTVYYEGITADRRPAGHCPATRRHDGGGGADGAAGPVDDDAANRSRRRTAA